METSWAEKIKRLRTLKNWSQQDLAHKLGTHCMVVSKWERGVQTPIRVHRRGIEELLLKAEGQAS